ncbi:AMP-binding protein [Nonomuraea sp. NPDC000554]|uniref:AMP-binding protein n=1 Tax=Nonomuraea sp. NPDC000554 TaxID=3154259 RepID=UPI0033206A22
MKPSASSTVIHEVFGRAYERGDRPALVDVGAGLAYGYRALVTEVTRAASGLVRRGARRDQVVGVQVSTAGAQTLAVHTVLAAGGVAAPIDPALPVREVAALLRECDARTLVVTPDLAESAALAADESRVRQVISLGTALDALDFGDLLALEPTALPVLDPKRQDALVLAGGHRLAHADLVGLMEELDLPVRLSESDAVLVAWPPDGGCGLVALVGLAVSRGALLVCAGGLDAARLPGLVREFGVTAVSDRAGALERLG